MLDNSECTNTSQALGNALKAIMYSYAVRKICSLHWKCLTRQACKLSKIWIRILAICWNILPWRSCLNASCIINCHVCHVGKQLLHLIPLRAPGTWIQYRICSTQMYVQELFRKVEGHQWKQKKNPWQQLHLKFLEQKKPVCVLSKNP